MCSSLFVCTRACVRFLLCICVLLFVCMARASVCFAVRPSTCHSVCIGRRGEARRGEARRGEARRGEALRTPPSRGLIIQEGVRPFTHSRVRLCVFCCLFCIFCVYVCMHACMHVCVCVCVSARLCLGVSIRFMHACVRVMCICGYAPSTARPPRPPPPHTHTHLSTQLPYFLL